VSGLEYSQYFNVFLLFKYFKMYKTSKISTIQFIKERTNQFWTTYYFDITFENGDSWSIWKKRMDALSVGMTLNYNLIMEKWFPHIKEVSDYDLNKWGFATTPVNQSTPVSTPSRSSSQNASFALSYAKDLVNGKSIEFKDLLPTADVLLERLNSK